VNKLNKAVFVLHSIALLLLSIYFLLLLLASGHRISFDDSSQLKFIMEMVIFLGVGIYLLTKWKSLVLHFDWVAVSLLVMVQLSLLDFYFETSSVEYEDNVPTTFFILFSLLFASNLFLIYTQFRIKRAIQP
jgi:hypothetical protein